MTDKMRILITGAGGFIAKNLITRLRYTTEHEIVPFTHQDDFSLIERELPTIDFIFHLAGVNRPQDTSEFYQGNTALTQQLAAALQAQPRAIPVVYSSSIQAAQDNDYGISKRQAEDGLLALKAKQPIYIYRLHNVFGKWCRPNYNSAVATFCNNIIHDLPIQVSNPTHEVKLVYVDDIVDDFIKLLDGGAPSASDGSYYHVEPVYTITLGALVGQLQSFKQSLESERVPATGDIFTKKLYATFISYGDQQSFVYAPQMHKDARGAFTELLKTPGAGQISVSHSVRGVTRGNHFHDTKMERFIVVKGKAKIIFRHMITGETMEFTVDDSKIEEVTIPVGYTHAIENLSDELILIIWANEELDPDKPDTFYEQVAI